MSDLGAVNAQPLPSSIRIWAKHSLIVGMQADILSLTPDAGHRRPTDFSSARSQWRASALRRLRQKQPARDPRQRLQALQLQRAKLLRCGRAGRHAHSATQLGTWLGRPGRERVVNQSSRLHVYGSWAAGRRMPGRPHSALFDQLNATSLRQASPTCTLYFCAVGTLSIVWNIIISALKTKLRARSREQLNGRRLPPPAWAAAVLDGAMTKVKRHDD